MPIPTNCPPTVCWQDPPTGPAVAVLDQTRLPTEEVALVCRDVPALVDAIARLAVRGAPALGVAGGYGVALAAARAEDVNAAAHALVAARPTAVNLSWAVHRVLTASDASHDRAGAALAEARRIEAEDAAASAGMARHGLPLVPCNARILTHCNTGRLVSAGEGTALAVITAAHTAGRVHRLWIGETRPLLQGARLTAYEAARAGIRHAVLADAAAGSLFTAGEVDLVIVGADRIAADGSVANKVGTFPLAVLAHHHGVPFVVVAPCSTIDLNTASGADIVVEQRDPGEVTSWSPAYNPAFDVTPPELVSALVTEGGVAAPVNTSTLAALLTT